MGRVRRRLRGVLFRMMGVLFRGEDLEAGDEMSIV